MQPDSAVTYSSLGGDVFELGREIETQCFRISLVRSVSDDKPVQLTVGVEASVERDGDGVFLKVNDAGFEKLDGTDETRVNIAGGGSKVGEWDIGADGSGGWSCVVVEFNVRISLANGWSSASQAGWASRECLSAGHERCDDEAKEKQNNCVRGA